MSLQQAIIPTTATPGCGAITRGFYTFRWTRAERRVFRRKRKVKPSVWSEKNRVVTMSVFKGRWRNSVTPYLAGIMDASFFLSVRTVIICAAPQTGKSECVNNCIGYAADMDPGPCLYVYPDENTARENSNDRVRPIFTSSRTLKRLLSGNPDDTATFRINLTVMPIYFSWARSASRLANKPIRYLVMDETDKYPVFASKKEAGPVELAEARTTTYRLNKKIWKLSSPSTEDGIIWVALTREAQVVFDYHVVCPQCGHEQAMVFEQIKWPKPEGERWDPESIKAKGLAYYECEHCGAHWDDAIRDQAVRLGRWVARGSGRSLMAELEATKPRKIGFHIPSWLSRFVGLSSVAAAFILSKDDPVKLRDFFNKHKAEPWKQVVVSTSEERILQARCGLRSQTVPQEAVALTCGIDVQKYGFWFVVRAWARDYTSWLVHYGQIPTWEDVESLLFGTAYPVDGMDGVTMRIVRAGIDTGGGEGAGSMSMTEETYWWIRKNAIGRGCRVWGLKGSSRPMASKVKVGRPLDKTPSGKPIPGGLQIAVIDTHQLKDAFFYRLDQAVEGGSMAAWLHTDTGKDYARQILAEEKRLTEKGTEEWVRVRKDNHLLDCELYAAVVADPEWPAGGIHLLPGRDAHGLGHASAQHGGRGAKKKKAGRRW